jgi:sigma-B regulation protein RsbU (phosphoserine phosphatase)
LNILVVDDNRNTQTFLRAWLENWEHAVVTTETVDEAWKLLNQSKFDMILSEWRPPQLDGLALCRLIRESKNIADTYVILYTSETGEFEFVAGVDVDVDDFLSVPLDEVTLRVRIRAAMRILNLRRTLAEQNANLNSLVQKLGAAFSSIESDLQAASAMQLSLLPTVSNVHPSFCVDWLVLPSSFLTGDNLNYFMVQERYLMFYHLDVAGHGIPSALLSVTLNQLLSPQPGSPMVRFDPKRDMKRIVPPVDVVSELNRRFAAQDSGYFTMIYGVLDTRTREIRFCQAGHPSPLQIAKDLTIRTVGDGGFPVGLWPEMTYEETTTTLFPGERFVLYSDGLLECVNPEGIPYSLDQLRLLLTDNAKSPVKEVLHTIQEELEGWSRGTSFHDDISMLIIESK